MPDFEVSVTICSWNTRDDLRACLTSLRACASEASFETIVVENASTDGSVKMVAEEFPEVRLLVQKANLGFSGGHNVAIKERRAADAILLNSDTVVHSGAIRTLIDYSRAHPEAGILGAKLLNPDGSLQYSCRRFPNPVAAFFRNTPLGRLFPKNRFTREYLMQDWPHDQARTVDWVSGAGLYATGACVERIGVLDDRFFMYCEDVDWCRRAWDAGFQVHYVPQAVITHAIGRSSDRVANRMIVCFHRSMLRYYAKHDLRRSPWVLRPILWSLAALALSTRASLFLLGNLRDELVRRCRR